MNCAERELETPKSPTNCTIDLLPKTTLTACGIILRLLATYIILICRFCEENIIRVAEVSPLQLILWLRFLFYLKPLIVVFEGYPAAASPITDKVETYRRISIYLVDKYPGS